MRKRERIQNRVTDGVETNRKWVELVQCLPQLLQPRNDDSIRPGQKEGCGHPAHSDQSEARETAHPKSC